MEQINEIERILKEWRDGTPDGESRSYFVIMAERTADGCKYCKYTASGEGLFIAEAMESVMEEDNDLKLVISTAVMRASLKKKRR